MVTVGFRQGIWWVHLPEGLSYAFSLRAHAQTFAQMAQRAEGVEYAGDLVRVPF